jgi:hypothetical protein
MHQTVFCFLITTRTDSGRAPRTELECGICGEHGGDPNAIE